MSWFSKRAPKQKPPLLAEVGKAIVTVETTTKEYVFRLTGHAFAEFGQVGVTSAYDVLQQWLDTCGSRGMWSVGNHELVPTHLITKISIKHEQHQIEVEQ